MKKLKCPSCGAEIKEKAKFCEICGAELPKSEDDEKNVETGKAQTIEEDDNIEELQKPKRNRDKTGVLGWICASIFILGGLGGLLEDFAFSSIAILCGLLCFQSVRNLVDIKHKNLVFNIIIILLLGLAGKLIES